MVQQFIARHSIVGLVGVAVTYGFWLTRPQWDPEMRLWKAIGDASLILLYATMASGPVAKIWPSAGYAARYRREMGIWFGILALLHTVLILNGWARWDMMRFLGYDFIPELGRLVRIEPGFGLANVGLVGVFITVALMVTSADWAMRALGGSAWKRSPLRVVHYILAGGVAHRVFPFPALHRAFPQKTAASGLVSLAFCPVDAWADQAANHRVFQDRASAQHYPKELFETGNREGLLVTEKMRSFGSVLKNVLDA